MIDSGYFGEILSVRGEFGYWVFTGEDQIPVQRPSWNYRKADGGGIILDMLPHWRYVLDNLFGAVEFYNNANEVMRIVNGSVGIGTTTPSARWQCLPIIACA